MIESTRWQTLLPLLLLVALPGAPLVAQGGAGEASRPTLHVLAIGVDEYEGQQLSAAVSDTRALSEALRQSVARAGTFSEVRVTRLLNEEATRSNVNEAIRQSVAEAEPEDVFVFFFSGVG